MNDNIQKCPETNDVAESREELLLQLARCLKNSRESKNLSLEEAAASLKLRMAYLEALESGQWEEMPGEVYALGFLKQYASMLGIDVSDSIEKLKTGDYKLTKPLTFPDPPIAPNRTWVIIAALAFVVLFILFNIFDSGEPGKPVESEVKHDQAQPAPDVESPPEAQTTEAAAVAPVDTNTTVEPPSTSGVVPAASISGLPEYEYRLSAIGGDVWLQVSTDPEEGEDSQLLQEALLKDGESIRIRNEAPYLLLTCGNAAALQIEINGKVTNPAGSLGEEGKVLRNFRLAVE